SAREHLNTFAPLLFKTQLPTPKAQRKQGRHIRSIPFAGFGERAPGSLVSRNGVVGHRRFSHDLSAIVTWAATGPNIIEQTANSPLKNHPVRAPGLQCMAISEEIL